jgi:hypothetical protein
LTYAESSATKSVSQLTPHEQLLSLERLSAEEPEISVIITREEEEIARYGGSDIHELPTRTPQTEHLPAKVVDWDGADDPSNPQNWNPKYKWCITIIAILGCLNV